MKVSSREELIEAIQATARALKTDRLGFDDFHRRTGIGMPVVHRYFNDWKEACAAGGIKSRAGPPPRRPMATREECLSELKRVATLLQGRELTQPAYRKCGGTISPRVIQTRLGSWTQALTTAGLARMRSALLQDAAQPQHVRDDLRRVLADVGPHLSSEEYDQRGSFSSNTAIKKLGGSWLAACREAGGKPGLGYNPPVALGQLADEFLDAVRRNGRIPSIHRLAGLTSRCNKTFGRRFGGYPWFKLQAIDHILASERPLSDKIRDLLGKERARCAARVKPVESSDRVPKPEPRPEDAPPKKGGDTLLAPLIDKLKRNDEHLDIEAKEAFFANTKHKDAKPGSPQPNTEEALRGMLKTVVAFANTIGGDLIIGLTNETWDLVGIDETDLRVCKGWEGFQKKFNQLVRNNIDGIALAPEVLKVMSAGRTFAIIKVSQLPKPCFKRKELAYLRHNEQAFVRENSESVELPRLNTTRHCDAMLAKIRN